MSYNVLLDCRYGKFLVNRNDWPIGTSLIEYGEYAMEELNFLSQLFTKDSVVVDAGANIGTHTVWFAQKCTGVVAIEPQRIAFQTLCANIQLNNLLNVMAYHAALGSHNGTIRVPERDQNHFNNFGGVPLAGVREGNDTALMTLDSLQFGRCDFIKADIEGMEYEFLLGAEQTIRKYRPILYMEADGAQVKQALQYLFDAEFDCYWHMPNLFNPDNFKENDKDVLKTTNSVMCSINMLCLPREMNIIYRHGKRIETIDEKVPETLSFCIDTPKAKAYYQQLEKELEHV